MCLHQGALTRRRFGFLTASAAATAILPVSARAAGHADALVVTCIDYRLVDDTTRFFDGLHMTHTYDQVSLAGAALAGVSPMFPSSNAAFWDQLALAKKLHDVKALFVLDHRDCGAYKAAFGTRFASERKAESEQHRSVMLQVKARLAKTFPDLGFRGYLMALDGTAEKLI
jgi:hypothetical protein